MRGRFAAVVILSAALFVSTVPIAAENSETFTARLSSLPADAKTRPNLVGSGSVSAVLTGTTLEVNGAFQGLVSPATTAQIYRGVARGVRGSAIFDLTISKAMSGKITGSFHLTGTQFDDLKKGQLYVQISSEKTPDGTLWGWLLP